MATSRRREKSQSIVVSVTPTSACAGPKSILDRMSADKHAVVLRALLKEQPDLRPQAEAIAADAVSSPSVEDIAEEVFDAVTSLDLDSLNDRAGKHSWGYVEPTEAAWELLQEAVEDVIADMKRRMDLGLDTAAEAICCGIVAGLHKATNVASDGPLAWAPDFPAEHGCYVVAELIRATPGETRAAVRDRLVDALLVLVPAWHDMISRAADREVHGE
jgi:hypothetical protein